MKSIIFALILIFLTSAVWYGEARKFFWTENGKCVTIWKTYNNVCYVMPYKYQGLWKPSNNFIETSNLNHLTLFFSAELPNTLIVQSKEEIRVYNKDGFTYLDYNVDSVRLNRLLYKPNAKFFFKDLKGDATLIDIDIKENYARGKGGGEVFK